MPFASRVHSGFAASLTLFLSLTLAIPAAADPRGTLQPVAIASAPQPIDVWERVEVDGGAVAGEAALRSYDEASQSYVVALLASEDARISGADLLLAFHVVRNLEPGEERRVTLDAPIDRIPTGYANVGIRVMSVEDEYAGALEHLEVERGTHGSVSQGLVFGTIFGGPLIGTLIGNAIGDAANSDNAGDEEAAEKAKAKGFADAESCIAALSEATGEREHEAATVALARALIVDGMIERGDDSDEDESDDGDSR